VARETPARGHPASPGLDTRRRNEITRPRPTRRGVAVAGIAVTLLALAVGTGDSALLLLVVGVALPLAIAPVILLARAHRAAGVEIHLMVTPPLVPVGAPCDLLVQLSHAGSVGLPALSLERPSDHWTIEGPTAGRSAAVRTRLWLAADVSGLIRWDRLDSLTGASLTVPLPTSRRGVFTLGPLQLWAHDPFALVGVTVAVARPVSLVVHPAAEPGPAASAVGRGSSGASRFADGPARSHTDDPGGEWSGLRPYRPGDRLHLLSWQAEARSGDLLVHDFRPDSEDVLTVVFDDRAGVHRRPAFEKALGALLGLASAAEDGVATDYDVSTLSGRRVRGSITPDGLVALMTFLAETQPTRSDPAPGAVSPSRPAHDVVVVTTPTAVSTLSPPLDASLVVVVE
jgi:uncharacterized protein (DUF58 family)